MKCKKTFGPLFIIQDGPKVSHPQYFEITSQKLQISILLLNYLEDRGFHDIPVIFNIWCDVHCCCGTPKSVFENSTKVMVVSWSFFLYPCKEHGLGCLNGLNCNLAHKFSITFKSVKFPGQSVQTSLKFLRMTVMN